MRMLLIVLALTCIALPKERKDTTIVYSFHADTIAIIRTYNDTSFLVSQDTLNVIPKLVPGEKSKNKK